MNFLKTLAAATLGTILAFVVIIFALFFIFMGIATSFGHKKEPTVANNSVLKINISGSLPARSLNTPIEDFLNPISKKTVSLQTLRNNLQKAAADNKIKGVLLDVHQVNEGWSNLQEAYQAISQFRDSTNKFIYATTNDAGLNEKGYYLASAADSVFVPPLSSFEFDGLYTQISYYKGLFDKLGIKVNIARHGKYKSAVEPFFRKHMSQADRHQLSQLLDETSHTFLQAVSRKSGKSITQLNNLLNQAPHLSASFGYKEGMIDSLMYHSQLDSLIKKRIGLSKNKSYNTISSDDFARVSDKSAGLNRPNVEGTIGVIYADGPIMNGQGNVNPLQGRQIITAPWFRKQLKHVTDNNDIKALVIRLNSPGGSGSASDAIWNMIRQTRKKMPVIVSMGPVDASGGYYMSVAADTIVAEPTTITGSIGVFGTKFDAKQFFNDKLGITFSDVESNKHADWLSPMHHFTPSEQKAFKSEITSFYHTFLARVAQGRGMTTQQVDQIAQGRVWTGRDAKKHHLVDLLGGMDKALHVAAKKAGIKHFRTESFPRKQNFIQQLMHATNDQIHTMLRGTFLGNEHVQKLHQDLSLLKKRGALLLLPWKIKIQ